MASSGIPGGPSSDLSFTLHQASWGIVSWWWQRHKEKETSVCESISGLFIISVHTPLAKASHKANDMDIRRNEDCDFFLPSITVTKLESIFVPEGVVASKSWQYFFFQLLSRLSGLLRWLSGKESACQCRRCRFDPWVRKIPWKWKWHPTPVFLPGKSHEQRSLAGYSPWGCKRVRNDLPTKQ